jgi:hypothetical protein
MERGNRAIYPYLVLNEPFVLLIEGLQNLESHFNSQISHPLLSVTAIAPKGMGLGMMWTAL